MLKNLAAIINAYVTVYFKHGCSDSELIQNYFKIFNPIIPFDFDGVNFHVVSSWKRKFQWFLIVIVFFRAWLYISNVYILQTQNEMQKTGVYVVWIVCYIFSIVEWLNGFYRGEKQSVMLNVWKANKEGPVTEFGIALRSISIMAHSILVVYVGLYFYNPSEDYFMYKRARLLITVYGDLQFCATLDWILYFGCAFYEGFLIYTVLGLHVICDATLIGICTSATITLSWLRGPQLPICETTLLAYRKFQLIERYINNGSRVIFSFIKGMAYIHLTYALISLIYSCIVKDMESLAISITFLIPICTKMRGFLVSMAQFNRESNKLLEYWKAQIRVKTEGTDGHYLIGERNLFGKIYISFKPVKISVNSMYGIKGSTVLMFINAVSNNTINALVAMKEQGHI